MRYNRQLMQAILWGRMDYLKDVIATKVISLDEAVDAYSTFSDGSAEKYIIDPHQSIRKAIEPRAQVEVRSAKRPAPLAKGTH